MKSLLITLAAVALLTTGCGAVAEAAPAPAKTITATPASIEEDDPRWDCLTMGSKTCGANPIERTEAWGHFKTSDIPQELQSKALRVSYYGLALPGVDFPPSEYVTYKAQLTADRIHVFRVEAIQE